MHIEIAKNIDAVRKKIAAAESLANRPSGSVTLLAASKGQPISKIQAAYNAGQRLFGENYLQEAITKIEVLRHQNDITWHYIGTIQRNKTRKIAEHFSWVQSVSDPHIAERLNDQRPADLPPLNICIEVNIDGEKSKSGIAIDEILSLVQFCLPLPRIRLRGIMSIPAIKNTVEAQRNSFHQLAIIFQQLNLRALKLDTLSMGMSEDFETAIIEGSTMVRVGQAIFGERL